MGNTNGQFISSLSSKFHPILEFWACLKSKKDVKPKQSAKKCDGNDEEKEEKTQEQPSRKEEERVHKEQELMMSSWWADDELLAGENEWNANQNH